MTTAAQLSLVQRLQQAFQFHAAGRRVDAALLCLALLEERGDVPDALYLLGEIARDSGLADAAEQYFVRAIALRPQSAFFHASFAHLLRDRMRWREAIDQYLLALAALSPRAPLYLALVACGAAPAQTPVANAAAGAPAGGAVEAEIPTTGPIGALRTAIATQLGIVYQQAGQLDAALACLRDALERQPGLADAHFNLGVVHAARREFEAAQASYRNAIALQPDFASAHCNLGAALKESNQAEAALASYLQALRYEPRHAQTLFNIGLLHAEARRLEQAHAAYEQALQAEPAMVEAHVNLAELLEQGGRHDDARRHRDLAYRTRNVFVADVPRAARSVLLLLDARSGNLPYPSLLDSQRTRIVKWLIAYGDAGQIGQLPDYDLVFNAIGDADAEAAASPLLAEFAAACVKPLLNRPDAVARTARDRVAALLSGIDDVCVPATRRVARDGDWSDDAALQYPLLLRPPGSHGGDGVARADTPAELAALEVGGKNDKEDGTDKADLYLSAFHDYRAADGYFRKYRVIFVDRQPYPYHLAISAHWMVHYATAQMTEYRWKLEEEQHFLQDPATALGTRGMAALRAIGTRLDLDYAGVDFSVLPDGRLIVFEANATMLAHRETDPLLTFKNPYVEAIFDAFEALLVRACHRP